MEQETVEEPKSEQREENNYNAGSHQEDEKGCTRFFSLAFYEQYFQVSQEQVVERIKLNFIPFKKEFIEKIR